MAENDTTDTAAVDDAASAEAAFGSGFAGDTKPPANGKAEPARDASQEQAAPPPETVSITKKEWEEIKAAASRTASYDSQFSKLFGTLGNVTKQLSSFQAKPTPDASPPARKKVEISKEAFAEMEKDFPELAQQTRAALEAALSGLPVNGADAIDATKIESLYSQYAAKREIEALEDAYPDWRTIVGAVDVSRETPDPDNAFRKWLAGKDEAYQNRINGSESAAVIGRAIRTFQRETAAPAAAKANGANGAAPRETARRDAIRAAVQPRGDNAGAGAGKSEEEQFESGFTSR